MKNPTNSILLILSGIIFGLSAPYLFNFIKGSVKTEGHRELEMKVDVAGNELMIWKTVIPTQHDQPGISLHRHEYARILIPLTEGILQRRDTDGSTIDYVLNIGKPMLLPEDSVNGFHTDENIGNKPIEVIIVQFTQQPVVVEPLLPADLKQILIMPKVISTIPEIDFIKNNTPWHEIMQKLSVNYQLSFDPAYTIDQGAIVVKSDGNTLFALLTGMQAPQNDTTFSNILIVSPSIKTSEGIGVGSLLADAVKVYGPVELSYNLENESREFATFAHGPQNIFFRTGSEEEAGIYQKGAYTTQAYKKDAKIKWMIVNLDANQ